MAILSHSSFELALDEFRKPLTQKQLEEYQNASLDSIRDELAQIQKQQENQKKMVHMSRIQSFLEAMEQFAKVIEIFVNANNVVAYIWGPIKFLLLTASTYTNSFEILLGAYKEIGEQLPLLEQYESIFRNEPCMVEALKLIYLDILEFHSRARDFFKKKIWHQVFNSVWNNFRTRFDSILADLNRHSELIKSQAFIIHFRETLDISANTQAVLQQLSVIEQEQKRARTLLEQAESNRNDANFMQLISWLAAKHPSNYHFMICDERKRFGTTGSWIHDQAQVKEWVHEEFPRNPLLWMHGVPGAGKTFLASSIIEHCLTKKDAATSYFYCQHADSETNTYLAILRSLMMQQVDPASDLLPWLHEQRALSKEQPALREDNTARKLFRAICRSGKRQYMIIDGLDECDHKQRRLILSCLNTLVHDVDQEDPGTLRVLVVSQDEKDIHRDLSNADTFELTDEDTQPDIEHYVAFRSQELKFRFELTETQRQGVADITCKRAAGLFLYAKLVMDDLLKSKSRNSLKLEIHEDRFPEGLNAAYGRIIERIERNVQDGLIGKDTWRQTQNLLGWMVCADRQLKWSEIQGAIAINPDKKRVEFEDRSLRQNVHDVCGSLVKILNDDRVILVHATAKEFITQSGYFHVPIIEWQLATLCMDYLSFRCFDPIIIGGSQLPGYVYSGYYPFADYAISKWQYHFRRAIENACALNDLGESESKDYEIQAFEEALEEFATKYSEDLTKSVNRARDSGKKFELPLAFCKLLNMVESQGYATSIWTHAEIICFDDLKAQQEISLSRLGRSVQRIRCGIELTVQNKALTKEQQNRLIKYYGNRRYKCSKLRCLFFHEGFEDDKARDDHVAGHDRRYHCTYTDCRTGRHGYKYPKDLEQHNLKYHSDLEILSELFPAPPEEQTDPSRKTWPCSICDKSFVRNNILKAHLLAHAGEKPNQCSTCRKRFTRKNDLTRHEKLHLRRR